MQIQTTQPLQGLALPNMSGLVSSWKWGRQKSLHSCSWAFVPAVLSSQHTLATSSSSLRPHSLWGSSSSHLLSACLRFLGFSPRCTPTGGATLHELIAMAKAHFLHLQNGDNTSASPSVLLRGLKELFFEKYFLEYRRHIKFICSCLSVSLSDFFPDCFSPLCFLIVQYLMMVTCIWTRNHLVPCKIVKLVPVYIPGSVVTFWKAVFVSYFVFCFP